MGLFNKKRKNDEIVEVNDCGCGKGDSCCSSDNKQNESSCCSSEKPSNTVEVGINENSILVLGNCCKKCDDLFQVVYNVIIENDLDYKVEKITDFETIASYGVMSTPGLVVNGKVVSVGKVLKKEEVLLFLKA